MQINTIVYDISKSMNIPLADIARAINQSPQNFNNKLRRGTLSLNELEQIADVLNINFSINYELPNKKVTLKKENIENSNVLDFAIFCIEGLKDKLHKSGKETYDLLTSLTNILYQYIVYNYEILHTQGEDYIMDDLLKVLKDKGIKL